MKTLYTDASYSWQSTEGADNVVRGKIAVSGEGINAIEKVAIGKVPDLKQYINVFELTAIARAVELASMQKWEDKSLEVYTDSKTAMYWAMSGKTKPKVSTEAHVSALEYLRRARLLFGGVVTFNFIRREGNPAGRLLEIELEKEAPHAI